MNKTDAEIQKEEREIGLDLIKFLGNTTEENSMEALGILMEAPKHILAEVILSMTLALNQVQTLSKETSNESGR